MHGSACVLSINATWLTTPDLLPPAREACALSNSEELVGGQEEKQELPLDLLKDLRVGVIFKQFCGALPATW